ncbi:hypothetical protein L6164_029552 [Bauhinia variegata]|uniref:Uncharacterized protein n=1 Tax=Bauhinia variegata TaxID=167791 RepID=A0ACB9L964_BAUVA|nr:hypothetical protein L6164_029552 [Bauhinia variegata]
MKQKIIIRVRLDCEKCRKKALKIAAVEQGVNSVALEGEEKDLLVVTGDGVDSVSLTKVLRKKLQQHASIVSVGTVRGDFDKEIRKKEGSKAFPLMNYNYNYSSSPYPSFPSTHYQTVVYDDSYPPTNCSIM